MERDYNLDPAINKELRFIDSLRVDETRSEYYEVSDRDHSEYRVYNQSQYLLSVLFKILGKDNLVQSARAITIENP